MFPFVRRAPFPASGSMRPVRSHPLAVRPQSDALGVQEVGGWVAVELWVGVEEGRVREDSKLCRGISECRWHFCILISEEAGGHG